MTDTPIADSELAELSRKVEKLIAGLAELAESERLQQARLVELATMISAQLPSRH